MEPECALELAASGDSDPWGSGCHSDAGSLQLEISDGDDGDRGDDEICVHHK